MDITNLSMEVVHPFKNPSTNYVTTFLSVDKLYELASTHTLTYTCIPPGFKQNVYFVIDDTINRQRRLSKKCSEYPDDCGAWRQGGNSTKPAYFIRSAQNSLHFVTYRAGIYGKMSKGNFVPLGLQPDSSTIVVAYRNSSYKNRVTWFNSEPVIATAIVEYIRE